MLNYRLLIKTIYKLITLFIVLLQLKSNISSWVEVHLPGVPLMREALRTAGGGWVAQSPSRHPRHLRLRVRRGRSITAEDSEAPNCSESCIITSIGLLIFGNVLNSSIWLLLSSSLCMLPGLIYNTIRRALYKYKIYICIYARKCKRAS